MRLIALANMKNEEWIIECWLKRTSEFADAIIVLDDGSTDATPDVLKAHPKVIKLIQNPPNKPYRMVENRNRLLEAASQFNPEWVFYLDADEIMDARLSNMIPNLMSRPDVGRYYFREITLWRSNSQYRVDNPDKYMRIHRSFPVMVRFTPVLVWKHPARQLLKRTIWLFIKNRRWPSAKSTASVLTGVKGRTIDLPDVVKLHYHFVDWERAWRRHMHYAVRKAPEEKMHLGQIPEIVDWGSQRLDEAGLELAPVNPEWGVL